MKASWDWKLEQGLVFKGDRGRQYPEFSTDPSALSRESNEQFTSTEKYLPDIL